MRRRASLLRNARQIAALAWPVFVGQLAVLAFSTVDTVLAARASALDLAALAVGAAAYISVFVGLMGVILAIGPIAGQLFGAGKLRESGLETEQAGWLALALCVPGCALLLFPEPFLRLAHAEPAVAAKVHGYLNGLAVALPAALLFTAYRGFNVAVSRPKAVMLLQLGALALKIPLSAALVFGFDLGALRVPAHGAVGCGMATAIIVWAQLAAALLVLRRDPFYAAFGLGRRPGRPRRSSIVALLALGIPMGLSILVEVTGFTFMAFFISRLGAIPVAGHQIAANMISMMFMLPLAIANATGVLVAQRVGAGAKADARQVAWHGLGLGFALAAAIGTLIFALRRQVVGLYTGDALVVAATLPLLAWVAVFHVADAGQTIAAFILRSYRIATVPLLVYVVAIWGVGLGGGYLVAFGLIGDAEAGWLRGAQGFWAMATVGLTAAALGLVGYLAWRLTRREPRPVAASA